MADDLAYYSIGFVERVSAMKIGSVKSWIVSVVLFVMCFLLAEAHATVYVDLNAPVGTNDGSSWANAFLTIQDGLDASPAGEEVWVADGTYMEAVALSSGDLLYGGFEGYAGLEETLLSQRDWEVNETTIDASTADAGSPALHAVSLVYISNARIDGFTVTGGHADSTATPDDSGAGIFLYYAYDTNTVANCVVRDNIAIFGGWWYWRRLLGCPYP